MKTPLLIFFMLILISCQESKKNPEERMEDTARRIHETVITMDTHDDINVQNFTDSINYTQDLETQVNLPKMIAGGLDVAWFIVYTGQDSLNTAGYARAEENAMAKFAAIHRLCEEIAPNNIALALTSDDVREIHGTGKKVAMIGVENAYPLAEDIGNMQTYYNLGARYMSLAHNGHSQFSDSNTGEKDSIWLHHGLSELGKSAVNEMNRLGIMIDVSHPSKEAMKQMINLSRAPLIASHSSARALCDHSRNLDDEQLLLLKENGGVVQTVAFSSYLNTEKDDVHAEFMKGVYKSVADSLGIEWFEFSEFSTLSEVQQNNLMQNAPRVRAMARAKAKGMPGTPPAVDVADFIDHVDYMVNLIGIDHVGISSDFDGGGGIDGWADASETFNVTLELVKRGYTEVEITKLWGGNLLRVLDEVQKVARQIDRDG